MHNYVECSARAQDGMKNVFEKVANCLIEEKKEAVYPS